MMYEDQRSTVLAVDNLNGAKVLERTLRVDHVRDYKQPKEKTGEGEFVEREEQSLNAKPEMIVGAWGLIFRSSSLLLTHVADDDAASDSSESDYADIDPEDPMRDYLIAQRKEEKALKKSKSKGKSKHKNETPEERRARKEKKREKKLKKKKTKTDGMRGVEDLLNELESMSRRRSAGRRSPSAASRDRSASRERYRNREDEMRRSSQRSPPMRSRSRSPVAAKREPYRTRSKSPPSGSSHSVARRDNYHDSRDRAKDYRSLPRRRGDSDHDRTPPPRSRGDRD